MTETPNYNLYLPDPGEDDWAGEVNDNFSTIDSNLGTDTEAVQDVVGALVSGGTNVTVSYDDANDVLTVDTSALNGEEVEDAVASLITAGNAITVNYDDANDTLSIAVDESSLSFYDGTNLTADVDNQSVTTEGASIADAYTLSAEEGASALTSVAQQHDAVHLTGSGEVEWTEPAEIPSGRTLQLSDALTLVPTSDGDFNQYSVDNEDAEALITNDDHANGNEDITIIGGHIDYKNRNDLNSTTAPVWLQNCTSVDIIRTRVDNVEYSGGTSSGPRDYNILFGDPKDAYAERCEVYDGGYEGIGIRGDANNVTLEHCIGSGMEYHAFQVARWPNSGAGTHSNINFLNPIAPSLDAVTVHGGGGSDNVNFIGGNAPQIRVYGGASDVTIRDTIIRESPAINLDGMGDGTVSDVSIENVTLTKGAWGAVMVYQDVDGVSVRGGTFKGNNIVRVLGNGTDLRIVDATLDPSADVSDPSRYAVNVTDGATLNGVSVRNCDLRNVDGIFGEATANDISGAVAVDNDCTSVGAVVGAGSVDDRLNYDNLGVDDSRTDQPPSPSPGDKILYDNGDGTYDYQEYIGGSWVTV